MNIFLYFTHFIFTSLIYQTFEKENKKLERILNSIKFIFSNIDKNIINEISFSVLYEKYNISFNNLRILKPLINESEIYEEKNDNEIFYNLIDIKLNFKAETDIQLFSENEGIIKYGNLFFNIYFENIKLKLVNDFFIKYEESNINYVNYSLLNELNFFSDFNQRKNCIFYESGKSPIIIEDLNYKLLNLFHTKFEEKIKEIEPKLNILAYDMSQIIDKSPKEFNVSGAYLEYIKINKFQIEPNYIIFDQAENSIKLFDINITGIYIVWTFDIRYKIICAKNNDNIPYIIFKGNKSNNTFEFNLEMCSLTDNNTIVSSEEYKDEVFEFLKNIYYKQLENSAKDYYNIYLN